VIIWLHTSQTACYLSDNKRLAINMTSFLNGPKNIDRIDLRTFDRIDL
jgi:hypothetical protein